MTKFIVNHAGTPYKFGTLDEAQAWVNTWEKGTVVTVTDTQPGPGDCMYTSFVSGEPGKVQSNAMPPHPLR